MSVLHPQVGQQEAWVEVHRDTLPLRDDYLIGLQRNLKARNDRP